MKQQIPNVSGRQILQALLRSLEDSIGSGQEEINQYLAESGIDNDRVLKKVMSKLKEIEKQARVERYQLLKEKVLSSLNNVRGTFDTLDETKIKSTLEEWLDPKLATTHFQKLEFLNKKDMLKILEEIEALRISEEEGDSEANDKE